MNTVFFGIAALVGALVLLRGFTSANPAKLAVLLRQAGAAALMAFAAALMMTGRFVLAIPIFLFAHGLAGATAGGYARWMRPFLGQWAAFLDVGRGKPTPGHRSTVRSAAIEMELDHDSGSISGRVLSGRFQGFELGRLTVEELMALWREIGSDLESRSLLEAYLDRRQPLWRQDAKADQTTRSGGTARTGPMTDDEAYQILGLGPGASEAEVREAHRRFMKAVHPDMGGSTFLAAKINEAKDRLVGKHGGRSNH